MLNSYAVTATLLRNIIDHQIGLYQRARDEERAPLNFEHLSDPPKKKKKKCNEFASFKVCILSFKCFIESFFNSINNLLIVKQK